MLFLLFCDVSYVTKGGYLYYAWLWFEMTGSACKLGHHSAVNPDLST